jgi:hypothetical protein
MPRKGNAFDSGFAKSDITFQSLYTVYNYINKYIFIIYLSIVKKIWSKFSIIYTKTDSYFTRKRTIFSFRPQSIVKLIVILFFGRTFSDI